MRVETFNRGYFVPRKKKPIDELVASVADDFDAFERDGVEIIPGLIAFDGCEGPAIKRKAA